MPKRRRKPRIPRGKPLAASSLILLMTAGSAASAAGLALLGVAVGVMIGDGAVAVSAGLGAGVVAALHLLSWAVFALIARWWPKLQTVALLGGYLLKLAVLIVAVLLVLKLMPAALLHRTALLVAFALAEMLTLIVYALIAQHHPVLEAD